MKAKIIASGEIIDVVKDGYMYIGEGGVNYSPCELHLLGTEEDFLKEFSRPRPVVSYDPWEQRRYEIAKDLYVRYENMTAGAAVRSADELIHQLKSIPYGQ